MPAPANDDLANAQVITGTSGTASGSNAGATSEADEVTYQWVWGGVTIWYAWTAPGAGTVSFDTFGSAFDTVLTVWDDSVGSTYPNLVYVAENDDAPGSGTTQSKVTFTAVSGRTYFVRIDGFDSSQQGSSVLTWDTLLPPTITGFSPASARYGDTITVTGTHFTGATAVTVGGTAVSFTVVSSTTITFTAPAVSGTITVTTPAGSDTTGTSLTVDPWVQQLDEIPDASETVSVDSGGGMLADLCALSDSVALLTYTDGAGAYRIRPVGVGASSLSVGTHTALAAKPLMCRLDDTHALLVWHETISGVVHGRTAVVQATNSTSAPTLGTVFDAGTTSLISDTLLEGLSASLAVTEFSAIEVSGNTITAVTALNTTAYLAALGSTIPRSLVRLSATGWLLVAHHFTGTNYTLSFTDVDYTSPTLTVGTTATHTGYPSPLPLGAPGLLRSDGDVVVSRSWLVVTPSMSGPTWVGVAATDPYDDRSAAWLTDDEDSIIAAVATDGTFATGNGTTLLLWTAPTTVDAKRPPLYESNYHIDHGADSAGFAGRAVLLAPDATTGVARLLLVAPDLPITGGWTVGFIRIG